MEKIGTNIEMHPATDRFMRGDRFGVIVGYSRPHWITRDNGQREYARAYRVKLARSGRTVNVHPDNLFPVQS